MSIFFANLGLNICYYFFFSEVWKNTQLREKAELQNLCEIGSIIEGDSYKKVYGSNIKFTVGYEW